MINNQTSSHRYSNQSTKVDYYNTGRGHAFSTAKQGSYGGGGVPYTQHYNYNQGFVRRIYHDQMASDTESSD